jgi:hypothetical protein
MNIYFSPISMASSYSLEVSGDSLILDSENYSLEYLSSIPEEGTLPRYIVSVTNEDATLLLPYWGDASDAVLYPEPLLNVQDGPVTLPK